MSAVSKLSATLSKDQAIQSLNDRLPAYAEAVRARLETVLWNEKTANLLEIQFFAPDDKQMKKILRRERPPVNGDWVEGLYKWTKGRTMDGYTLRAGVEPIAIDACVDASVAYFTSAETMQLIGDQLVVELKLNDQLQALIVQQLKSTGQLTKREIQDLMKIHGGQTVAQHAHDAIANNVHHLMATKLGTMLSHMLGAALAMPAVKMAIAKAIYVALSHAAIQHMLAVAAKHAGIAVIAVVIFGSAGASIVSWMLVPIVAAVLIHQYQTLPEKLAKKVTPQVVSEIRKQAPAINKSVIDAVTDALFEEFFKLSEQQMQGLHNKAMEYWQDQQ